MFRLPQLETKSEEKFTADQLDLLEHVFKNTKYLTPILKDNLAKVLNVSKSKLEDWFHEHKEKTERSSMGTSLDGA